MLAENAIYLVAEKKEIKDIILFDTLKGTVLQGDLVCTVECSMLTLKFSMYCRM